MNTHTFGMLECEVQSGDEWYFHGNEVVVRDSSGKGVILVGRCDCDHDRANANRIVACVNACKGINPEAVPELVNALHLIADAHSDCGMTYCQDVARAAIAKAKGVSHV